MTRGHVILMSKTKLNFIILIIKLISFMINKIKTNKKCLTKNNGVTPTSRTMHVNVMVTYVYVCRMHKNVGIFGLLCNDFEQ